MPSLEPDQPFVKQMSDMRPAWLQWPKQSSPTAFSMGSANTIVTNNNGTASSVSASTPTAIAPSHAAVSSSAGIIHSSIHVTSVSASSSPPPTSSSLHSSHNHSSSSIHSTSNTNAAVTQVTSLSHSPSLSNLSPHSPTAGTCCCGLSLLVLIRLSFAIALIATVVLSIFHFSEVKNIFMDTLVYTRELGPWRGSIVLCIANIIGALLFMPCVPFTLGAGFLYGTFIGSVIVSIASTVAAVIAFLTARYLARKWIERSLGSSGSKFRILDNAIQQDGFRIVLLIRSSPLHPYGVCNYLFGLTSVTGRDYTIASFVGMLPATVMEVYFGSASSAIADIINGDMSNSMLSRVFFWAGLVVSMIVTVVITILLRRKLKTEMDKYSRLSTSEHDLEADDDDGWMGGLGGGTSCNEQEQLELTARLDSTAEHDSAVSDAAPSDNERDQSADAVSLQIASAINGDASDNNSPDIRPLSAPIVKGKSGNRLSTSVALQVAPPEAGATNKTTRRTSKPKPLAKPNESIAASPSALVAPPASSPTASRKKDSALASPTQPTLLTSLNVSSVSPPSSHLAHDDEDAAHESQSLIEDTSSKHI